MWILPALATDYFLNCSQSTICLQKNIEILSVWAYANLLIVFKTAPTLLEASSYSFCKLIVSTWLLVQISCKLWRGSWTFNQWINAGRMVALLLITFSDVMNLKWMAKTSTTILGRYCCSFYSLYGITVDFNHISYIAND